MNLPLLLEMAASGLGERVVLSGRSGDISAAELRSRALIGADLVASTGAKSVVFLARNGPAFPVAMFAGAISGVPVVPLNYRLGPEQLVDMITASEPALVIAEESMTEGLGGLRLSLTPDEWLERTERSYTVASVDTADSPDRVAVKLYTSGTTGGPKAALLRHHHLTSYVFSTVEFASADEHHASLVSVPPYHIAGVSNTITNVYAGRRVVHLPDFTAEDWLATARQESITHALVVPTMLARLVDYLDGSPPDVPTLRTIAYGGAPMPTSVIERALALFPDVDFVNAYGLTETSSTIALLGPEDHCSAATSEDPEIRSRLGSVGRLVPGIEGEIRSSDGTVLPAGQPGMLWVRGPQVSGEYRHSTANDDGWFCTRDEAYFDDAEYLFILGRADDTIIRGGENIAPAEIEDVLRGHPAVADAAVVGLPDDEWGQRIVAAVVPEPGNIHSDQLREAVRASLRSSKAPDAVVFVEYLPYSELGKISRRAVAELVDKAQ